MNLHLCIPVLNRYDLLRELLLSLRGSSLSPTEIHIIDNGRNEERLKATVFGTFGAAFNVWTPQRPMGLAEAWNLFIAKTSEERLIVNDDVTFGPDSLRTMVEAKGDLIEHVGINMCSCFLLRDSCVEKVGLFDERISPGYAYFEDCDYAERMELAGAVRTAVDCGIRHVGSATPAKYTQAEKDEHDRRFKLAQRNFIIKWGRMPKGIQGPLGMPTEMVEQL